jgi:DNA mismatch repair protein MutS2
MTDLMKKHIKSLELDKVLALLADECSCPQSADFALSLLPYTEIDTVKQLLNQTNDAFNLIARYGGPSFYGLKLVASSLRHAEIGGTLSMKELLDIAYILKIIRGLYQWRESAGEKATCLDELFYNLSPNKYMEDRITNIILSEEDMADNASSELATIRRHIKNAISKARESIEKIIRSQAHQKHLQEAIVTIRGGRFVVPVKQEYKNEIPGLVHDTSASGATLFVEPMAAVEANNELKVLESREQKEIARILTELSNEVGTFAPKIAEDNKTAIGLDFIFAKARLAAKQRAAVPEISEDGKINLRRAKHPLIDPQKVVPVDIRLGDDFDTLMITGPNTGGKTVALKTLGLLTLMAMCGMMIPVSDGSCISVFDRVLADIGDEQSIEQSLSTFSAHMTNITKIIEVADFRSLILLDELGAGTDPVEGAALAEAILEHLRERGAKIAATTHYAELKVYALETKGVENACCEFDVATLCPTYKLLIGVPGRSNAFAISERLGLSVDIVDNARQKVSSENTRFEDVVSGLEASRQAMEGQKEDAERLKSEVAKLKKQAEEELKRLEAAKDKEMEKARTEARRIVESTKIQSEELLNQLDEMKKKADEESLATLTQRAKQERTARINKMEDTADPIRQRAVDINYKLPRPLRAGDTVTVVDIDRKAAVLSSTNADGFTEVRAGIINMRVHIRNLRLIEQIRPKEPELGRIRNVSRASMPVKQELDLRGMMTDEGISELDKFIDDSLIAGLGLVTIIHGKGTGAMRAAVHQFLKTHKSIKSFRLGKYGEGETGVTIVEL